MTTNDPRPENPSGRFRLGEQHARLKRALNRLQHRRHRRYRDLAEQLAGQAADVLAALADQAEAEHPDVDELARLQARTDGLVERATALAAARRARRSGGTS